MQYCSLQHGTLLLSPVTSTTGHGFCFGSIPSFFLKLFLHWSPVAYLAPTDLGSSSFSILSFCLFILFMGFSRQEYLSGLPLPSPVDHILSDLGCDGPHRSAPAATGPRPRSGVATESARLWQRWCSGREELPHLRGQGQRPRGASPPPRSGAAAEKSFPRSKDRGSGLEELPHALGQGRRPRGATPPPRSGCCGAQEGWEELLHIQSHEGRLWEKNPRPR